MEQKSFGVRISLVQELRSFQLNLQRKRRAMPFTCMAEVRFCGGPSAMRQVIADQQSLSVIPSIINRCSLPRQVPFEFNEAGLVIKIDEILFLTMTFNTIEDRVQFLRALGNLDFSSSSDEEPDENQVQINENQGNGII